MAQFPLNPYNEFNREFPLRSLYFKKLFFKKEEIILALWERG
jgi:hypothetical protein